MLLQLKTDIELNLRAPTDCCCNCGQTGAVTLINTAMPRTQYFVLFGTERVFHQALPYCRSCQRSAIRVRPRIYGQLLVLSLMVALLFLIGAFMHEMLPTVIQEHLFASSVGLAALYTCALYYWTMYRSTLRSHYQPVRLLNFDINHGVLDYVELGFHNPEYARLFAQANATLVEAGAIEVVSWRG